MNAAVKRFQVKGVNDDRDFCECCGKSNLRCVVWIEDTETGEIKHFGTTCALKPSKGFDCGADIRAELASLKSRIKAYTSGVGAAYRKAGGRMVSTGPTESMASDLPLWQRLWDEAVARAHRDHIGQR